MLFRGLIPMMAIAFTLIAIVLIALIRARHDREGWRVMGSAGRVAFWVRTAFNALAAFTWTMTLIEFLPLRTRIPLSDYGAPVGASLLLALTPAAIVAYRILRRESGAVSRSLRRYAAWSTALHVVSLYPGVQIALFYGTLIFFGNE